MIDLTDEIDLLEVASLPATLSDDSDEVQFIKETHPALTVQAFLAGVHVGHQIMMTHELPKKRYASSGVNDLIHRHLENRQNEERTEPEEKKKSGKRRIQDLDVTGWFEERPWKPKGRKGQKQSLEPIIPVILHDGMQDPRSVLVLELWYFSPDLASSDSSNPVSSSPTPKRSKRRRETPTEKDVFPVSKRPRISAFPPSSSNPTVDEFLNSILLERENNRKPLSEIHPEDVTLTLESRPSLPLTVSQLTPDQQHFLELEIRRHNRNNVTDFYTRLLSLDLFNGKEDVRLEQIPVQFRDGKQYLDAFKTAFFEEMNARLESVPEKIDVEQGMRLVLQLHKEKDAFAYLMVSHPDFPYFPSFRPGDLLLCIHASESWWPDKPLKRPDQPYFLGIIERAEEDQVSAPFIKTKASEELKNLFEKNKQSQFYAVSIDSAATLVREIRALQLVEFSDLFPLLMQPSALYPPQPLSIPDSFFTGIKSSYNPSQISALKDVCQRGAGISLIQGPPGTGKTHTIVGLISAFLCSRAHWEKKPAVLVCAPSNNAVNEIALRIVVDGAFNQFGDRWKGFTCVRVGKNKKDDFYLGKEMPKELESITLRELVTERLGLDGNRDRAAAINQISAELGKVGKALRQAKTQGQDAVVISLLKQQRSLHEKLSREKYDKSLESEKRKALETEILNNADIVFTTLASARCKEMEKLASPIDFLIVDEACQSIEPTALIPIQRKTRHLVLIGDPMQLPATIVSEQAAWAGYGRSLFERLMKGGLQVSVLTEQYRMAPYIRSFPSQEFYFGKLTDAKSIQTRKRPGWISQVPFAFLDLQTSEEHRDPKGSSYGNHPEVDFVSELILTFHQRFEELDIAVISPYRRQVQLIRERVQTITGVEVDTVDGFQGREKDAVVISTVRTGGSLGFLMDSRRLNVAITRAKFGLWVVGCAKTLRKSEEWAHFLRHCEENGCFLECREFAQVANLFRIARKPS